MKTLRLVLFACVAAAASVSPAAAACMSSHPIRSAAGTDPADRSFIWSSTVFAPFYFPTYAPLAYVPPITSQLQASFWVSGLGDPAYGAGQDNGSRSLAADGDLAFVHDTSPFDIYFAAELDSDWSSSGVDGCPASGGCTCLLLSDVDSQQRNGLFALVGAANDPVGGTFFNLTGSDPLGNGEPIVLQEVPRPVVTDVQRPQADTVEITVTVPGRARGVYEAASGAGCACGPTEYLIRRQIVPRDSPAPTGRAPGSWPVAPLAGGGGQTATPVNGSVTVEATCAGGDADVYLVTELFFDSGFSTAFVSGNSIPVECGGNLSGEFLLDVRNLFQQPRPRGKNR